MGGAGRRQAGGVELLDEAVLVAAFFSPDSGKVFAGASHSGAWQEMTGVEGQSDHLIRTKGNVPVASRRRRREQREGFDVDSWVVSLCMAPPAGKGWVKWKYLVVRRAAANRVLASHRDSRHICCRSLEALFFCSCTTDTALWIAALIFPGTLPLVLWAPLANWVL